MKRIKEPQNKDYSIACPCGETFKANADQGVLIGDTEGNTTRNWNCPRCGQPFIEPRQEPITLEAFEPSNNKNEVIN